MNPLLSTFETPFDTVPFHKIDTSDYLPAVKDAIRQAKEALESLKKNPDEPTFENTIVALENCQEHVNLISRVFFNIHAAETNKELQDAAKEISPLVTEHGNDILLDETLFQKIEQVYLKKNELSLSPEQQMLLDKTYKSFVRNGAKLSNEEKKQLREIDVALSKLSLEFGDHVLHETNTFELYIDQAQDLAGLPENVREAAAQRAKDEGKEGQWLFTLAYPSFVPFMKYAENRSLREKLYRAFFSKGFHGDEYDNQEIIKKIAQLRHQRANLLGYETHAHFMLEERMAENPQKVSDFLQDLLQKSKPIAQSQVKELADYAKKIGGIETLQSWDFSFYSEKFKKEKFQIDDEILKPYFQLEKVIDGIFEIAQKLYGLTFKEVKNIPVYHPEVITYEVLDKAGKYKSVFYADLFPRPGKRAGAWMTFYRHQKLDQRPHVSIVCNFSPSTTNQPSLLNFREVQTLFHEFGHALHMMLSDCTYGSLSGTHVYWDFVELPSQIMENWTYEEEALDLFARHFESNEAIPREYLHRIKEMAQYMEGYQTLRQIGFAQLDMAWHAQDPSHITEVEAFEKNALAPTSLLPEVQGCSVSTSFSHIFQGGYSSGYYSYKWAEVLDADAFELFKEKGIFNSTVAQSFANDVLSKGGSEHPMTLYTRFRGKEPSVEALLKRGGLVSA